MRTWADNETYDEKLERELNDCLENYDAFGEVILAEYMHMRPQVLMNNVSKKYKGIIVLQRVDKKPFVLDSYMRLMEQTSTWCEGDIIRIYVKGPEPEWPIFKLQHLLGNEVTDTLGMIIFEQKEDDRLLIEEMMRENAEDDEY